MMKPINGYSDNINRWGNILTGKSMRSHTTHNTMIKPAERGSILPRKGLAGREANLGWSDPVRDTPVPPDEDSERGLGGGRHLGCSFPWRRGKAYLEGIEKRYVVRGHSRIP